MKSIQASKLLQRLDETTADAKFPDNLRVIFDQFSQRVSPELGQINRLFDEYTPHDDIHMESLFSITDELLGEEAIQRLNGCETCVLACAIYGHDWGMAVSWHEKERIVTGKLPIGAAERDFALLQDEQLRWQRFARSAGVGDGPHRYVEEASAVSRDHWREYVRQTHADRANARARNYFKGKNDLDKLGMPVGEVCAGHWYDMAQIRRLPTSWSIGGQSINLQALAIYMRFIDLLDIGNNRTPFALWKFINPRNAVSATEWSKHRAISPITCRPAALGLANGRILQVHGETDDYRVFAALQDLKRYMEDQIRENVATLQEFANRSLGMIALDWKVEPRGFEPIDMRFEFDRNSMFNLVSGEIYDGDPYVFIRELLQNAIDATELRRRRSATDGLTLEDTVIRVSVDHHPNGDAEVTVTDRGTGMDLGIVRDYLAVVGRSYYRSREFDELETGMTPISRFGVGLLSCFEVADSISLKTRTNSDSYGLDVEIADRSQQFRIRMISGVGPVGTSVHTRAKASKWRTGEFSESDALQVTDYVKAIAGFVSFPIHVSEHGKDSVVCSALTPDTDLEVLRRRFPDAELYRFPSAHGVREAVAPQDFHAASRLLNTHTFRFSRDSEGAHVEGLMDYFIPNGEVLSSTRRVTGGRQGGLFSTNQMGIPREIQLRWAIEQSEKSGISPSVRTSPLTRIYLRGILLPDTKHHAYTPSGMPPCRLVINIEGDSDEFIPSLSRRELRNRPDVIREVVEEEFSKELFARYSDDYLNAQPIDRLLLLGRLARYVAPPPSLLRCFCIETLPAVTLNETGTLSVVQVDQLPDEIEIAPKWFFQKQKNTSGSYRWANESISEKRLKDTERIVQSTRTMVVVNFGFEYDDGSPMEWNELDNFLSLVIRRRYRRKGVRLCVVDKEPYIIERREIGKGK